MGWHWFRYLDHGSQRVEYFSCVHLSAAPPPSVIAIDCFDALFPPAPEADMLTKALSLVTSTLGFEWLPPTTGTAQHNPQHRDRIAELAYEGGGGVAG